MKKYWLKNLNKKDYLELLKRKSINFSASFEVVKPILEDIKIAGLKAALKYAEKFDNFEGDYRVSREEIEESEKLIEGDVKKAIERAYRNIEKFHLQQKPKSYFVETISGVNCSREFRAIDNVGLYIPGGSVPLPSTVLMLGIPAKIAGCRRIVAASPSKKGKISSEILYAAKLCGIDEFYKIGGAQAVGLLAYSSEEVKRVDKIFGPGNQYVTAAKMLVSIDPDGCSIDMPAGPSEVLVIGDKNADPDFIASDLLSQAEHGTDSQVIFVTPDGILADKVLDKLEEQKRNLMRKKIVDHSLSNSFILIVENIAEALEFSNNYAPEHLILNIEEAKKYIPEIQNAGSVFLGPFTPESAGDYASGTNHSLPTYGYAKSVSGISVESFMKSISFQDISFEGLKSLSKTITDLAEAEKLDAHANAVKVRLK